MEIFSDYIELFSTRTWWYRYNLLRILGVVLTWMMPILFGVIVKELIAQMNLSPNPWTVTAWLANWKILLLILLVLASWGLGGWLNYYTRFKNTKSEELFNGIMWMCDDIFTKGEIESTIRCTVWVPIKPIAGRPISRLIQACNYYPNLSKISNQNSFRPNGRKFRTYKITKKNNPIGILGFTALACQNNEEKICSERLAANTNFVEYMIKKWHFSQFNAKRLTQFQC
jgi:hypothetical protein